MMSTLAQFDKFEHQIDCKMESVIAAQIPDTQLSAANILDHRRLAEVESATEELAVLTTQKHAVLEDNLVAARKRQEVDLAASSDKINKRVLAFESTFAARCDSGSSRSNQSDDAVHDVQELKSDTFITRSEIKDLIVGTMQAAVTPMAETLSAKLVELEMRISRCSSYLVGFLM